MNAAEHMGASGHMGAAGEPRKVYMVLSPRSLSYARGALESLFRGSVEPVDLRLITDSASDRTELEEALSLLKADGRHQSSVTSEEELNDAEAQRFRGFAHLRAFRHGHPCWRKVTDPLLMASDGEEMILLDPDLYFPNRFTFEPTPQTGLLLMWQQPNCLLPAEVVRRAMAAGVRLARHVDIGVSHWRAGADLAWLDWMLGQLSGGASLPRMMHVEAIVWAAIALREGGGYLDPALWVCWHRTQTKRLRLKLGASGEGLLRTEPWGTLKCFHAGGEAKWWVPAHMERHSLAHAQAAVLGPGRTMPFVELTPRRYEGEQRAKGMLRGLGYYRLFGGRPA